MSEGEVTSGNLHESSSLQEQRRLPEFRDGFIIGIRDVLIITAVLFVLFLLKIPGILLALVLLPLVSSLGTQYWWIGVPLLYFLIAFGFNIGYKALHWTARHELKQPYVIGNIVGSLISALIISPFALTLAVWGFLLFLGPISF